MTSADQTTTIFRVDKFSVPVEAREPFLEKLRTIRSILDGLEGCRQNLILEQPQHAGVAKFVTIVEWCDGQALEKARQHAAAEYSKVNFNPQEFMRQLGVTADLGNFTVV